MSRKNEIKRYIADLALMYKEVREGSADLNAIKTARSVSGQALQYMKFEHVLNTRKSSKPKTKKAA